MKLLKKHEAAIKRVHDDSWDFSGANTKYCTHGMHTYPAMMIPQIAKRLIDEYGNDAEVMLDPFMGTGTSLVEAKIHHNFKYAYGVDVNPLARLVAKVKTYPISIEKLEHSFRELRNNIDNEKLEIHFQGKKIEKPSFFNINFWFKPEVIEDLAIIKKYIWELQNTDIKDFYKVCFSETVRNVSNTRNREFKLYKMNEKQLEKHNPNTIQEFYKQVQKNLISMKDLIANDKNAKIKILNEDSRYKLSVPDDSVDLILTSPPYGDSLTTVAYGQFSRLSLQWLGFDYKEEVRDIDKICLGGIKTRSLEHTTKSPTLDLIINQIAEYDNNRAKDVLSFYEDLFKCILEFKRVMKKNGILCFVVGNRTVKRINIPTDVIMVELFQSSGNYEHIKTIIRNIPSKRMPKANSPTNVKGTTVTTMNHEYIVILQIK
ncbi:MAG: hypothetical protein PHU28_00580 [Methanosarcinaceae archaeon]|nr:hypothetical protein [Methanosarcinaceae archaeon]